MKSKWTRNGKDAGARDLAEALALGRAHRKKQADAAREVQERDAHARAVGRSIRQSLRDQSCRRCSIGCRPANVSATKKGGVRLRRFELMVGLAHPSRFTGGGKHLSSFYFKLTSRGAGSHRKAKDRPYKAGEAVRAIRYILRESAREIEGGGIVGYISTDPDVVASLFAALEELELTAGRENANVYMSLVVSLPHELNGAEREALLARICTPLAEHGLPHVGILHAPDPNGDQRNQHAHVMFSWRPFESRGDGSYGFSEQTFGELNGTTFITEFRARSAEAMNEAMAAAGHTRRFTPLSRAALGEAPKDESAGKLTAGEKHASRRQEDIALAKVERRALAERQAALARVEEATRTIISRAPFDRDDRLAALVEAEITVVARRAERLAAERALTLPAAVTVSAVPAGVAEQRLSRERTPEVGPVSSGNVVTPLETVEVTGSTNVVSAGDAPRALDGADVPMPSASAVSHEKPEPRRAVPDDVGAVMERSAGELSEADRLAPEQAEVTEPTVSAMRGPKKSASSLEVAREAARARLRSGVAAKAPPSGRSVGGPASFTMADEDGASRERDPSRLESTIPASTDQIVPEKSQPVIATKTVFGPESTEPDERQMKKSRRRESVEPEHHLPPDKDELVDREEAKAVSPSSVQPDEASPGSSTRQGGLFSQAQSGRRPPKATSAKGPGEDEPSLPPTTKGHER